MLNLRVSDYHVVKAMGIVLFLLLALSCSENALAKQNIEMRQQATIDNKSSHLIVAKGQLYVAPRNDQAYRMPC